ncbi:MAG TPA: flagellar basal body rod protein FlgC [bacterium]|nr:flagellar basal body rod protein FlgC [bacterium]
MGLFDTFAISGSGLTAERLRLDLIASNLANANTTRPPGETPFQRQLALFQTKYAAGGPGRGNGPLGSLGGVRVRQIVPDGSPGRRVHDPSHPDADPDGYVTYPNVNSISEMVDMMAASRAYEANLTALNSGKELFLRALNIQQ